MDKVFRKLPDQQKVPPICRRPQTFADLTWLEDTLCELYVRQECLRSVCTKILFRLILDVVVVPAEDCSFLLLSFSNC